MSIEREARKPVGLIHVLAIVLPVAGLLLANWIRVEVAIAESNAKIVQLQHEIQDNKEDMILFNRDLEKLDQDIEKGFEKINQQLNKILIEMQNKQDRK